MRNGAGAGDESVLIEREGVRVERLERGRRRPRERHVEPPDRRERLAELLAQARRGAAERREHLLFLRHLDLFARHHVAALRVDGFDRDHVVAAEAGNRPGQQRFQLFALRHFAATDRSSG
jgi:hypothetical protein